jgi:hypothetical protein
MHSGEAMNGVVSGREGWMNGVGVGKEKVYEEDVVMLEVCAMLSLTDGQS